jgi:hypothetical protein
VNNLTDKTMGSLKKYIPLIIIVLPLIIAVVIRGTGTGHFRYDAGRWAEPSFNGSNIITPGGLSQLKGDIMVLNFANDPANPPVSKNQIAISPDSLLSKNMMKKIGRNKGAVVLWSDDSAIAARIWMVLSQTGIKDLYILSLSASDETIKEKFRADTLISPEL